ncbi:hypothetical protein GCM10023216_14680 [Isoptericola chiayiensis]|uniref:Uncharacterized protein n=1 Tax=Isoptericola chiayiensis TaxID=579446 RepID=A0ABP8YAK1_9MICO|nr:hypothetical protein [Isoptericola chiayiensis]NOW02098.1 hypothetical protein [Isoptericola chiayiensis]
MSGGPYSRERRRASLKGFGYLALIGGPAAVLVSLVMAFGLWSAGDDDSSFGLRSTVAAGDSLVVNEPDATVVLWATPGDIELGEVSCETRDSSLPMDGAPQEPGAAVQLDDDGAQWVRLNAVEGMQRSVTCSGPGMTEFGYAADAEVDQDRGAWFFGVFGVLVTGAGLLARRLTRNSSGRP